MSLHTIPFVFTLAQPRYSTQRTCLVVGILIILVILIHSRDSPAMMFHKENMFRDVSIAVGILTICIVGTGKSGAVKAFMWKPVSFALKIVTTVLLGVTLVITVFALVAALITFGIWNLSNPPKPIQPARPSEVQPVPASPSQELPKEVQWLLDAAIEAATAFGKSCSDAKAKADAALAAPE